MQDQQQQQLLRRARHVTFCPHVVRVMPPSLAMPLDHQATRFVVPMGTTERLTRAAILLGGCTTFSYALER